MWRRGSRAVVKVVFIWLFLAAFHFWKRAFVSEWRAPHTLSSTQTHVRERERDLVVQIADDVRLKEERIVEKAILSRELEQNEGSLHWIKGGPHVAVSRQLLAFPINCTPRAVEQFPSDMLTGEQRREGFIVLHVLLAIYMFMGLALVCDRYFIPSLEILCECQCWGSFLALQNVKANGKFPCGDCGD